MLPFAKRHQSTVGKNFRWLEGIDEDSRCLCESPLKNQGVITKTGIEQGKIEE